MIFPILNGVLSFSRAPVTWAIFFLNFFVFINTYNASDKTQSKIENLVKDEVFGRTQGFVFAKFISNNQNRYPANLQNLAKQSLLFFDGEKRHLLGSLAMRDSFFLQNASKIENKFFGDQVAFQWWQENFSELISLREMHPSYSLGITKQESGFERLITYQFTHSGFSHFAGNMIFFLLFASSLEVLIGGLGVLCTYLFAGAAAAIAFSFLSEASAIPLIGASGAVSGIMALFCVLLWNKKVRYIYFLMVPKRGYAGFISLPAWITLILWFFSDLAGHWATPPELGGVAYSAHIGGELCGIILGLCILLAARTKFTKSLAK